jgi:hypothetical protein
MADGADGLGNLVDAAAGKPTERVLDWFQISMRLQLIEQMSSQMAMAVGDSDAELKQLLLEKVPRIRYQLWHGKRETALERIDAVYRAANRLEGCGSSDYAERVRRFRQQMIWLARLFTQQLEWIKELRGRDATRLEDIERHARGRR